eukprot:m.130167 g.130167  ORF g.130167 m.130167 type:complete len:138 (+) comp17465_c0_seq1:167-580(+)
MGASMSQAIGDSVSSKMEATQRTMMIRQIELNAAQIRERQMAMQIAKAKDQLYFFGAFYTLAVPACIIRKFVAPILPLTFALAYQADFVYGNKMERIRADAEAILEDPLLRAKLLALPTGEPTMDAIDESIRAKGRS